MTTTETHANFSAERATFLQTTCWCILVVTALHLIASYFHFYWMFWWYDILLHFLGGVWVGLSLIWLRYYSGYMGRPHLVHAEVVVYMIIGTLIIGSLWEVFEAVVGVNTSPEGYAFDTIMDLAMALCGAFVAYAFFLTRPYAKSRLK